jgi:hypothetical protein
MAAKCGHKSKKLLEKKVANVEEVPCAYAATVTNITYQMLYECKELWRKVD